MKIQEFDYSVDLLQHVLWQYNDASNLQALIQAKQDWYDENHTQFWQDWARDVFDLRTANAFGLSVWSIILDLPLYGEQEASPSDYPAFGFGDFGLNFDNGNFATDPDGFVSLPDSEKRILLQLRFFSLVNDATIPTINTFLNFLFGDDYVYARDNYDMTMKYVFLQDPGRRLLNAMTELDVLPRPSAVDLTVEVVQMPGTPSGLQAVATDGNVVLTWVAPVSGIPPFTYAVFRDGVEIATGLTDLTYSDTGLSSGTYTYTVRATNSAGNGPQSLSTDATVVGSEPLAPVFTQRASSASARLVTAVSGPGVSLVGGAGELLRSADDLAWAVPATPPAGISILCSSFGEGLYVVAGSSSNGLQTSPDGLTWTPRSRSPSTVPVSDMAYNGSLFVYVTPSGFIATSDDGVNWSNIGSRPFGGENYRCLEFANNIFLTATDNGLVASSPDGVSWSEVATLFSGQRVVGLAFGSSNWVAVGDDAALATSSDNGVTWVARTHPLTFDLNSVAYGGGFFIIGGDNGSMAISQDDGVTWTALDSSFGSSDIEDIHFTGSRFIAVGEDGKIASSTLL